MCCAVTTLSEASRPPLGVLEAELSVVVVLWVLTLRTVALLLSIRYERGRRVIGCVERGGNRR